jgi:magnesium-transporting ATPase (P-type)
MNTPKGIIGIVTYNGLDTKLLQNQNKSRYKQSGVEIETNKIVMGMLIFTILAGLVLAYLEFR